MSFKPAQRYREIAPIFLVAISKQEFYALLISTVLPRMMWGVVWKVKSISWTFQSSYGGVEGCFQVFFLHRCKLELFKSKQIWVDGNIYLFSHGPYRAVYSDRDLAILFVYKRDFNWSQELFYRVHYFIFWRRGDVASLVMYSIDANLRIVITSLYRTALPFSILCGSIVV